MSSIIKGVLLIAFINLLLTLHLASILASGDIFLITFTVILVMLLLVFAGIAYTLDTIHFLRHKRHKRRGTLSFSKLGSIVNSWGVIVFITYFILLYMGQTIPRISLMLGYAMIFSIYMIYRTIYNYKNADTPTAERNGRFVQQENLREVYNDPSIAADIIHIK